MLPSGVDCGCGCDKQINRGDQIAAGELIKKELVHN